MCRPGVQQWSPSLSLLHDPPTLSFHGPRTQTQQSPLPLQRISSCMGYVYTVGEYSGSSLFQTSMGQKKDLLGVHISEVERLVISLAVSSLTNEVEKVSCLEGVYTYRGVLT